MSNDKTLHLTIGAASWRHTTEPVTAADSDEPVFAIPTAQAIAYAAELPNGGALVHAHVIDLDPTAPTSNYTPNRGCLKSVVAALQTLVPPAKRDMTTVTVLTDRFDASDQFSGTRPGNGDLVRQIKGLTTSYNKVVLMPGNPKTSPITALAQQAAQELLDGSDATYDARLTAEEYEAHKAALTEANAAEYLLADWGI